MDKDSPLSKYGILLLFSPDYTEKFNYGEILASNNDVFYLESDKLVNFGKYSFVSDFWFDFGLKGIQEQEPERIWLHKSHGYRHFLIYLKDKNLKYPMEGFINAKGSYFEIIYITEYSIKANFYF